MRDGLTEILRVLGDNANLAGVRLRVCGYVWTVSCGGMRLLKGAGGLLSQMQEHPSRWLDEWKREGLRRRRVRFFPSLIPL